MANREHILLAVLDWGLGHASRCVPLIEQWQKEGHQVTIASADKALAFLKASVSGVAYLELPAYAVRYPTPSMVVNMAWQSPRLWKVVRQEQGLVQAYAVAKQVTQIVSDGRFGCYCPGLRNIWLAHQLHIQHPFGLLSRGMNSVYHAYIRRCFHEVWVPDWEGADGLAGALSEPIAGLPHRYLGPLSRFAEKAPKTESSTQYHWLALLSGPEPQRTRLEEEITELLLTQNKPALIIRGVPGETVIHKISTQVSTVDWLLGAELQQQIDRSKQLICRSGYSTLMDAYYWQKPLLLIPTPGQTEQEYLAQYWAQKTWAKQQQQGEIDLR